MPPSFQVRTDVLDGDVIAVAVIGELDQATVPSLREELDPAIDTRSEDLLLDLSGCEFIDSSGLAAFVSARERVTGAGRRFAVCCPESQVRKLLELTGLDRAMGLADSRDEALAALRADVSPEPA